MSTEAAVSSSVWTIDPTHSQVEFGVRHMMISTVKGFFPGVTGTVRIDENDLTTALVEVDIDAGTIDTRNPDRDAHLRSADFFDVENHPNLSFRSTGVASSDEGVRLTGELTIRGVTRTVELKVETLGGGTDPWGNERQAYRGETRIHRNDFGLTWNQALEAGGVLVSDEVRITIEVQLVRQA